MARALAAQTKDLPVTAGFHSTSILHHFHKMCLFTAEAKMMDIIPRVDVQIVLCCWRQACYISI